MSSNSRFSLMALGVLAATALSAQEIPDETPEVPVGVDDAEAPDTAEVPGDPTAATEEAAAAPASLETESRRTFFSTSVALGVARDQSGVAGEDVADTALVAQPTLLLYHRPSERSSLTFAYAPEGERYQEENELDAIHHAAGARFELGVSRRSKLFVGASLLEGEDPSRHLSQLRVILPRGEYQRTNGHLGWDWERGETTLRILAGRTATRIEPGPGIFAAGLDQTEDMAFVGFGRSFTGGAAVNASYTFSSPSSQPIAGGSFADDVDAVDNPIHAFAAGASYAPGRFGFHVTGGAVQEQSEGLTYLAAAEVNGSVDRFSFRLRYDRSPLSLGPADYSEQGASGLATVPVRGALSHSATLGVAARPVDRLRLEALYWTARTTLPESGTIASTSWATRMVLELTRRVGLFLRFDRFDQDSPSFLDDASRDRISLGAIVGLSGPPASWGVERDSELLKATLPYERTLQ